MGAMEMEMNEVQRWIDECIKRGWMEHVGVDETGDPLYRLTEAGVAYVESMPSPAKE